MQILFKNYLYFFTTHVNFLLCIQKTIRHTCSGKNKNGKYD